MKIAVKCPVCRANNILTSEQTNCRRCKEDLLLLYKIKGYSYKNRIYLLRALLTKEDNCKSFAEEAMSLKSDLA